MSARVPLAPTVSRFDFERFASGSAWRLHEVFERTAEQPYEEIWMTDDLSIMAHYIEDEIIAVSYVVVAGVNERRAVAELTARLRTVDPHSAGREACTAPSTRARLRAISYLAASAPSAAQSDLVTVFAELLADERPEIRLGAVLATAYPSWYELDPLLERVASADPEPQLRDAATKTIAAIRDQRSRTEA